MERYGQIVAVVGASADKGKFSNKAVRAFKEAGYTVVPINPSYPELEGLKCYKRISDYPDQIDFVSVYLPPHISMQINLASELKKKEVKAAIINPGAESDALIDAIKDAGIETLMICSIRALGRDPSDM